MLPVRVKSPSLLPRLLHFIDNVLFIKYYHLDTTILYRDGGWLGLGSGSGSGLGSGSGSGLGPPIVGRVTHSGDPLL